MKRPVTGRQTPVAVIRNGLVVEAETQKGRKAQAQVRFSVLQSLASGSPQVEHTPSPPFVWCLREPLGKDGDDRARA